jgi:hypothetical protein
MTQEASLEKIKSVQGVVLVMLEETKSCAEFIQDYTANSGQGLYLLL